MQPAAAEVHYGESAGPAGRRAAALQICESAESGLSRSGRARWSTGGIIRVLHDHELIDLLMVTGRILESPVILTIPV